jgi:hypothetical protein
MGNQINPQIIKTYYKNDPPILHNVICDARNTYSNYDYITAIAYYRDLQASVIRMRPDNQKALIQYCLCALFLNAITELNWSYN